MKDSNQDGAEYLSQFSEDGQEIITNLWHIQPGDTVIYHVGKLTPEGEAYADASRYRLQSGGSDHELREIQRNALEAVEAGRCKLFQIMISEAQSVYAAIGI